MTAVSPKEFHCFPLPKFIQQVIRGKAVFVESEVGHLKPHLCGEHATYKIIPRPES